MNNKIRTFRLAKQRIDSSYYLMACGVFLCQEGLADVFGMRVLKPKPRRIRIKVSKRYMRDWVRFESDEFGNRWYANGRYVQCTIWGQRKLFRTLAKPGKLSRRRIYLKLEKV